MIPMWVRRPPGSEGKSLPVVVEFHGGPEYQALPGYNPFAQLIVEQGFIYVEPNVRGSFGYGRKWLEADNRLKRENVITDIEDASIFIREKWGAEKVAVLGYSYGGLSSLLGMTRFAGAYDVGVSIVGIANFSTFLENTAPYRRKLRIAEYGDPTIQAERGALERLSPINHVDKIKAPMLLIHGVNDPRVPVKEALQFYDELVKKQIPAKLVLQQGEGHGASSHDGQIIEWGHVVSFLREQLLDDDSGGGSGLQESTGS